ncbi:MAG: phytanoyl-CoA dioxygenase family protein [Phycisphaeraceae bacterium]
MIQTLEPTIVKPLTLAPNEVRFYKHEGYLYLPGLLDGPTAAAMRQEVIDIMQATGMSLEQLRRAATTADKLRQSGQYLRDSVIDQVVNSPALCQIAGQLMEGPSSLYMPFTAVKSGGGGGRFHFHQDNQYTRFDGPGINLWIALDAMTPENGCLQVVPRSHLRGTLESDASGDGDTHRKTRLEPENFLPVRMSPGDCIAFSRLTVHGSGPNTTDQPRVAYAAQFHRDDVKAVWDQQPPRLLKGASRWPTGPIDRLTPPSQPRSQDGH